MLSGFKFKQKTKKNFKKTWCTQYKLSTCIQPRRQACFGGQKNKEGLDHDLLMKTMENNPPKTVDMMLKYLQTDALTPGCL